MTHENKELLIKDISARLPYGICFYFEKMPGIFHLYSIKEDHMFPSNDFDVLLNDKFPIQWCKPYLRPKSSISDLITAKEWSSLGGIELIDWYNANHIDYRDLIPLGLALEAPEDIYK
jgi:hypothetical protein